MLAQTLPKGSFLIIPMKSRLQKNAFVLASESSDGSVFAVLLAKTDKQTKMSVFHAAASYGHGKVLRNLLLCGDIDVNALWEGRTALMRAICKGHPEEVEMLLTRFDVDIFRCDGEKRTALDYAIEMVGEKPNTRFIEIGVLLVAATAGISGGCIAKSEHLSEYAAGSAEAFVVERGLEARRHVEERFHKRASLMRSCLPEMLHDLVVAEITKFSFVPPAQSLSMLRRSNPDWWQELVQLPAL
jgi:hypothetical protein